MIAAFTTSPNRRAHLATAILGGLVVVLLCAGLWGWSDLSRQAAHIEERRFDLQAIAARLKARGPGLARAERTLAADPFLPGATATLAANGFQRRIVALAEDSGVTLKTIGAEPAADDDKDGLPHVVLQASATARIAGLQKLLHHIETEAPFVLVDEVSIRAPQAPAEGRSASRDPDLEIELRLFGYLERKGGRP